MYRADTGGRVPGGHGGGAAEPLWRMCLAIAATRRTGCLVPGGGDLILGSAGDGSIEVSPGPAADTQALATWRAQAGWALPAAADPLEADLLELYEPLLRLPSHTPFVLAHLGQSIDGQIATRTGDSRYVNCADNITHLHRLRALCDAVIVGRGTATVDDPMLTTRLVPGPSPVRVVLDPEGRLPTNLRLLTDSRADTLVACAREHLGPAQRRFGVSRVVGVKRADDRLDLSDLRVRLAERGLHVLFVEGGGVTVSRFVEQGAADRLHLTVAPVMVGAGRKGLQLDGAPLMRDNLRPAYRLFRMGTDVLWDFDLREPVPGGGGAAPGSGLRFIG